MKIYYYAKFVVNEKCFNVFMSNIFIHFSAANVVKFMKV